MIDNPYYTQIDNYTYSFYYNKDVRDFDQAQLCYGDKDKDYVFIFWNTIIQ